MNEEKIYVNFPHKNIKELLLGLFSYHPNTDISKNIATYYDPECTVMQCASGRNRSFTDVYALVLTYYPETKIEDLIYELATLEVIDNEGNKKMLYNFFCPDIKKPVMHFRVREWIKPNGISSANGDDRWSWKDLLAMININTPKELYDLNVKVNENKEINAEVVC